MPNSSFADFLAKWRTLVTNASVHIGSGELPELMEPYRAALEMALEQVEELSDDVKIRRGVKQKGQRELDVLKRKARYHSNKLVLLLIGHYGPDNPRLLDFGIKPRPVKLRPASEGEESEPETPPAPPVEIEALETAKAPKAAEPSPAPEAKPAA